jgi:acylphosphatase
MVRAHVFFSGTVQGVGFRYTCRSYAADLGLTGWVKNLADGRVELMAEGSRETIEQLLQSIDKHFDGYLRNKDIDVHDSTGTSFTDFRIVF